jgi:hypothetical protein
MDAGTTSRVASSPFREGSYARWLCKVTEPSAWAILLGLAIAMLFVIATRLPVARTSALEWDDFEYVKQTAVCWFPMHHTLFLTFGRVAGLVAPTPYLGFVWLDMITSAAALAAAWWWLRAIVPPAVAAAAALILGVGPVFWGYGAMAGNYTAIVLVGSLLLGIAYRGWSRKSAWQPMAAAVALALGNGYRSDLGTLWLPVFALILWQHRWKRALWGGCLFAVINLAWFMPMLHDVGGWERYRQASAEFAYQAGYLSSVWNLGIIDSPLRNTVKVGMALVWTLGPGLVFVPRGVRALRNLDHGAALGFLTMLSVLPALASHLLVQFGVQGWCFHYVPALLGLLALGASARPVESPGSSALSGQGAGRGNRPIPSVSPGRFLAATWGLNPIEATPRFAFRGTKSVVALGIVAIILATMFLFYPTDYQSPGFRGSFDLAFCRFTRAGLRMPMPAQAPRYWRTANSRAWVDRSGRS